MSGQDESELKDNFDVDGCCSHVKMTRSRSATPALILRVLGAIVCYPVSAPVKHLARLARQA